MKVYTMDAVSSEVKSIIDLALSGEEVLFTNASGPVARVVPTSDVSSRMRRSNGAEILEIFKQLRKHGGIDIDDPVAWQREIRKDRPLPGRE